MKTVLVTGDSWYIDTDGIMSGLEHLFKVKALPEQFKVITTRAEGVETVIEPILASAGIEVEVVSELPEVIDIVVVFLSDKEPRAYEIMMNQWHSRKPVYPFKVTQRERNKSSEQAPQSGDE